MMRNRGWDPTFLFLLVLLFIVAPSLTGGDLFDRRPVEQIIAILLAFIVATTIHEFMHAWTAWRLGDDTARSLGRITLNPAAHFEPFGFIGMVLIALGFGAFGWGKPVPVNPNRFRHTIRRRQLGMAAVAFAGPLSNVVQAIAAIIPLRLAERSGEDLGALGFYLAWYVWVNILLASFNMIPIPPLDGHKILTGLLPNFWYPVLAPLERYGFLILFGIIFIGGRAGSELFIGMYDPVRTTLIDALVGDGFLRGFDRYLSFYG